MGNDHSHILEAYKRRVEAQAGRAISDEEIIESLERRPPNEIIDLNSCGQHLLVEAKKHVDEQVRKLREFYEKREFIAEYGNKLLESLDAKHRDTQNGTSNAYLLFSSPTRSPQYRVSSIRRGLNRPATEIPRCWPHTTEHSCARLRARL